MLKDYLGDSVYAEIENGMVKLTTENGLPSDPSNTIYLEPAVFTGLQEYVKYVEKLIEAGVNNEST